MKKKGICRICIQHFDDIYGHVKTIHKDLLPKKVFVHYWWFTGWDNIALGININWRLPNIEIHLPFGFIRFGLFDNFEVTDYGVATHISDKR